MACAPCEARKKALLEAKKSRKVEAKPPAPKAPVHRNSGSAYTK